jgi:tagatose-1,6-bisphosphate aldolase non-catalytic subunit AgaZ/GatZ
MKKVTKCLKNHENKHLLNFVDKKMKKSQKTWKKMRKGAHNDKKMNKWMKCNEKIIFWIFQERMGKCIK